MLLYKWQFKTFVLTAAIQIWGQPVNRLITGKNNTDKHEGRRTIWLGAAKD